MVDQGARSEWRGSNEVRVDEKPLPIKTNRECDNYCLKYVRKPHPAQDKLTRSKNTPLGRRSESFLRRVGSVIHDSNSIIAGPLAPS